jgi:hypothetical protein
MHALFFIICKLFVIIADPDLSSEFVTSEW